MEGGNSMASQPSLVSPTLAPLGLQLAWCLCTRLCIPSPHLCPFGKLSTALQCLVVLHQAQLCQAWTSKSSSVPTCGPLQPQSPLVALCSHRLLNNHIIDTIYWNIDISKHKYIYILLSVTSLPNQKKCIFSRVFRYWIAFLLWLDTFLYSPENGSLMLIF